MKELENREAEMVEGGLKVGYLQAAIQIGKLIYQLGVSFGRSIERTFFNLC